MAYYRAGRKRRFGIPQRIAMLLVILLIVVLGGVFISHQRYNHGLRAVSSDQQTQIFTVKQGDTVKTIADDLESAHLIRSAWAFQLYVHSKELSSQLQAGTYAFSPSETAEQIVKTLTTGDVATRLVTILPGRRIDQVRADLINSGFSPTSVDNALNPTQYSDVPVLSYKPANATTLEGLLWPDSYQKGTDTDPSVIVREALVAMGVHLNSDVQAAFAAEGLSVYQGLTLTSIVLQEVNKPTDQAQAAQVFLSRLKNDMMLGSDVTANYGAVAAGQKPNLTYDSPYNTLLHKGLPPTPISTVSNSALVAATHPAATNYLYFVTGDDGTTYFSNNVTDHEALTDKYCHKLCGR